MSKNLIARLLYGMAILTISSIAFAAQSISLTHLNGTLIGNASEFVQIRYTAAISNSFTATVNGEIGDGHCGLEFVYPTQSGSAKFHTKLMTGNSPQSLWNFASEMPADALPTGQLEITAYCSSVYFPSDLTTSNITARDPNTYTLPYRFSDYILRKEFDGLDGAGYTASVYLEPRLYSVFDAEGLVQETRANIYLAAVLPDGRIFFKEGLSFDSIIGMPTRVQWTQWNGGAIPKYMGYSKMMTTTIDIVKSISTAGLNGTVLYAGFGADDADLLNNARYIPVAVIP